MKPGTTNYMPSGAITPTSLKRTFLYKTRYLIVRAGQGIVNGLTKKSTYVEIICALFVILFIYTGLNKLMDYETFKFQLGRSPFLQNFDAIIATTLPTGELLLALILVVRRTRLLGLYLSFTLMTLFTGYIWIMINESYYLPCSCGGILASMSWNDHLLFNAIFSGLAMVAIILLNQKIKHTKFISKI
jgi:hypothetical protein